MHLLFMVVIILISHFFPEIFEVPKSQPLGVSQMNVSLIETHSSKISHILKTYDIGQFWIDNSNTLQIFYPARNSSDLISKQIIIISH